jgi:DNA invertase Pin-like site-specific DNA recombinase
MKHRIAFYLRNSTESQDYQYQLDSLNDSLKSRNDVELVGIFQEKVSGFKSEEERPEMRKLMDAVENNLIDEIWVNEFTRLSRSALGLMKIVRFCAERGVNIYFKNQNINSLENGELNFILNMLLTILSQFAEMDAKNMKDKLIQGKETKVKFGNYVGGVLPLGYTYVNDVEKKTKQIVIDENEKKIVQYIFKSFVEDEKSLRRICIDLNNNKNIFSTKTKTIWYPQTISFILKNSWYNGFRQYKNEIINLDKSLIFISKDQFEKAQQLLNTNKTKFTPRKFNYILNEKLFCHCGNKMIPRSKNTNTHIYMCKKNVNYLFGQDNKCDSKNIEIEKIENAIWILVKNKIFDFRIEIEKKIDIKENVNKKIEENNIEIQNIKNKIIKELNNKRERIINSYQLFGGDIESIKKKIAIIDSDIKIQNKIISDKESENKRYLISLKNIDIDIASEIDRNIEIIENDRNLIKHYINILIKKITILQSNYRFINIIKVDWNKDINNNSITYLFYNSRVKIMKKIYYIQSYFNDINISYDSDNKVFIFEYGNEKISNTMDEITKLFNDNKTDFVTYHPFNEVQKHIAIGTIPFDIVISFSN